MSAADVRIINTFKSYQHRKKADKDVRAPLLNGKAKIEEYIAHRLERENQILEALRSGAQTTPELVAKVYAGINEKLIELAGKSVEAHLEKLRADGRI